MKSTPKTEEAEKWVDEYIEDNTYPPTYHELSIGLGISKTAAYARCRMFRDKLTTAATIDWEPSLRDYFAGQAIQGILAGAERTGSADDLAQQGYTVADAMLIERKKE